MNKELFKTYADLNDQMTKLKEVMDLTRQQIMDEMETADVDKIESDFGSFSVFTKTTVKYNNEVTEEIKKIQGKAKKDGKYESVETNVLRFTKAKE